MPINFTLTHDLGTGQDDTDDSGVDVDEIPLVGPVRITAQFSDDRAVLAPGASPRPKGYKFPVFHGYMDVDGQLKNRAGGAVGVRVWGNDPIFGLDHLWYRVDFDVSTPMGQTVKVGGGFFEAPVSDTSIPLAQVLTGPGSHIVATGRQLGMYVADIIGSGATGRTLLATSTKAAARSAIDADPVDNNDGSATFASGASVVSSADPVKARAKIGLGTIVPLDDFNPDADWGAAVVAAVASANTSGGTVVLKRGKTYVAGTGAVLTDVPVRIDFNGAKVVRSAAMANVSALAIRHSNSTPQAVVALLASAYDWGGSSDTTPCTRIELASTAGWSVGDRIVIVGDDPIPGADPSFGQREGERGVRVAGVVGNYLYLARPLKVTLSTNVRVARLSVLDVGLIDPWVEDDPTSPVTRNVAAIEIRQVVKPRVVRPKMRNLLTEGIKFMGCVDGVVEYSDAFNLRTSAANAAYGYGIRLQSCCDFKFPGADASFTRHAVTTGADQNPPPGSPDLWRYGSNIGHRIFGGNAGEVGHAAFDTHDEAAYTVYDSCHVSGNHREPSGSFVPFKIRGRHNMVRDCTTIGPGAIELNSFDGGGNHRVINHTHITPPGYGSVGVFIKVDYSERVSGGRGVAELSGRDYAPGTSVARLTMNKASVTIPDLSFVFDTALSPYRLIQMTNSDANGNTIIVDLRGSTGDPRIFQTLDSSSAIRIDKLIVIAGGATWRVGDFNNFNGSISIGRIETDTLPTSFMFSSVGSSASAYVGDLLLNEQSVLAGIDARSNADVTLTSLAKATQFLDVPLTGARTVTESTVAYLVGGQGRTIRYIRTANATGAFAWNIGGDSLTTPGTWLERTWSGTAWSTTGKGTLDGTASNLTVASLAGSAVVVESEAITANDNDTTLPTSAAVLDLVQKMAQLSAPLAYTSGSYDFCNSKNASSTSVTLTADRARTSAWLVTAPLPVATLLAEFTVAGDAASVFRIGIWNDDGSGKPGTLLLDAGSISTGSGNAGTVATGGTPGAYEVPVSVTLQPGLYHVGGAVQGVTTTQPTMRTISGGNVPFTGAMATSLASMGTGAAGSGWYKDGFTGAFGAITSPVRNTSNATAAVRIGFKVA